MLKAINRVQVEELIELLLRDDDVKHRLPYNTSASPWNRWKLFLSFRFQEFLFELVDSLLHCAYPRVEQSHIEKRHVIGGCIKRVAVDQPRAKVDFDVC